MAAGALVPSIRAELATWLIDLGPRRYPDFDLHLAPSSPASFWRAEPLPLFRSPAPTRGPIKVTIIYRAKYHRLQRIHSNRSALCRRVFRTSGSVHWPTRRNTTTQSWDFNEVIRISPQLALAYNSRGDVSAPERRLRPRHCADYNEAIRLDPRLVPMHSSTEATFGSDKREYERAISDYSEAVRFDPQKAAAYFPIGATHGACCEIVTAPWPTTTRPSASTQGMSMH